MRNKNTIKPCLQDRIVLATNTVLMLLFGILILYPCGYNNRCVFMAELFLTLYDSCARYQHRIYGYWYTSAT